MAHHGGGAGGGGGRGYGKAGGGGHGAGKGNAGAGGAGPQAPSRRNPGGSYLVCEAAGCPGRDGSPGWTWDSISTRTCFLCRAPAPPDVLARPPGKHDVEGAPALPRNTLANRAAAACGGGVGDVRYGGLQPGGSAQAARRPAGGMPLPLPPPGDLSGSNMHNPNVPNIGTHKDGLAMAANLRGFRWGLGDELASHTAAGDVHARQSGTDAHARGTTHSGPGDVGLVRPDGSVEYSAGAAVRGALACAISERRTASGSASPTRAPPDCAAIPKGPAGSGNASGNVHSGQMPKHLGAPVGTPSHAPATPLLAARAGAAGAQHGAPPGSPSDAPAGGGADGDATMGGAGPPAEPALPDASAGDGLVWPPADSTIPQLETWLDAMRILPIDPTVEAKCLLLETRLADARA